MTGKDGKKARVVRLAAISLVVAFSLGLLEAAWTPPSGGGPFNTALGCLAILIVLFLTTWPRIWWIPALAILEEITQGTVGTGFGWMPSWSTVTNHWSTSFVGFNFYPYLLFPILTLIGEIAWRFALPRIRAWVPLASGKQESSSLSLKEAD